MTLGYDDVSEATKTAENACVVIEGSHSYGTRSKKVNVLRAYYTYGYGRTTTMATGVLRLRAYNAYGYGRATLTATGVLV